MSKTNLYVSGKCCMQIAVVECIETDALSFLSGAGASQPQYLSCIHLCDLAHLINMVVDMFAFCVLHI